MKATASDQKMVKTKAICKVTYIWHSPSKAEQSGHESAVSCKRESFRHILIL